MSALDFGHIKVSRKLFADNPFWNEPREFSRAEAWIDLIQRAAWGAHVHSFGPHNVVLERGEFVASLRYLASAWGWSGPSRVRRFLEQLRELDQIAEQRTEQVGTVYLLVNYDTYQGDPTESGTPTERAGQRNTKRNTKRNADRTRTEHPARPASAAGASGCEADDMENGTPTERQRNDERNTKRNKGEASIKQVTTTPLTPQTVKAAEAAGRSGAPDGDKTPKPSAMPYTPDFETAWRAYPARDGGNPKRRAFKAWCARLREGADPAELIRAAGEYADDCRRRGKLGTEFVMQAATFFGPDERWRAFLRQRQSDYERRHFPGLERKPGYVNPLLDPNNVRIVDYDPWSRTRVA